VGHGRRGLVRVQHVVVHVVAVDVVHSHRTLLRAVHASEERAVAGLLREGNVVVGRGGPAHVLGELRLRVGGAQLYDRGHGGEGGRGGRGQHGESTPFHGSPPRGSGCVLHGEPIGDRPAATSGEIPILWAPRTGETRDGPSSELRAFCRCLGRDTRARTACRVGGTC